MATNDLLARRSWEASTTSKYSTNKLFIVATNTGTHELSTLLNATLSPQELFKLRVSFPFENFTVNFTIETHIPPFA